MIANQKYLIDGSSNLLGGVDEGTQPLLLKEDKVARAINVTMRGGYPATRPGFNRLPLTFARAEYGNWFIDHIFQGSARYDDFRNSEKIICSVGGRIFRIDPFNGYGVTEITPRKITTTTVAFTTGGNVTPVAVSVSDLTTIYAGYPVYINGKEFMVASKTGAAINVINNEMAAGVGVNTGATVEYLDPNNPNNPNAWFEQAEEYHIIQDDQSRPIIFTGASSRRAATYFEVPTGSAMAYGNGRLWVAVNRGREFMAGDISGGPTGVLGFTENNFLAGGGAFTVGSNVGKIRSMKFVMNLDTSLGQGPLQILCDKAIFSVNAPVERSAWATVTNPIQTISLINFGATGNNSTVLVNGDLFFRAQDGLRSFFIARRDFGTWGNTPISTEMWRTMNNDTPSLLLNSCAVVFDNRLLFTSVPQSGRNGVRHKCLVVLDFDLISTLSAKSPPVYDGIWTGIESTSLLTGDFAKKPRCFAFAHDKDGYNTLWEITRDARFDNEVFPIRSRLEYRGMSFPNKSSVSGLKRLHGAELWVTEFEDEVDFTLTYKPDQHPCWQDWAVKDICIVSDQCSDTDPCDSLTTGTNMVGYKTRLSFGVPPDVDNAPDEKAMRGAFNFQPCIEWNGYAVLGGIAIYAHEEEEWGIAPPSDDRTVCGIIQCCPPDPFEYVSRCIGNKSFWVINDGDGIEFTFAYEPGASYEIWATFEGETYPLIEFPPSGDDSWLDPDGWFAYNMPDLASEIAGLVTGDEIDIYLQATMCDNTTVIEATMFLFVDN